MKSHQKAMDDLKSLGDFDDPSGPAASLQAETLMEELRQSALENPSQTFRISESGPEQTIAEILADLDKDRAGIDALKRALRQQR